MTNIIILIFLLTLLGCTHPESQEYDREKEVVDYNSPGKQSGDSINGYKVIGVKDGDTFVLLMDGKEQVVRFAHIDCPEKKQPFGNKAKQYVSEICFGKYVTLIHKNEYDRNMRLIAEVILDDSTNLNKELVRQGLAWHFKKYSDDDEYGQLEANARLNRVGLWSGANPIAPWEWR